MKKIGRKKKKALYKRLQKLDRKYEEIMEKSNAIAFTYLYEYGNWSTLDAIYVKLRYFLVLKWAEENHVKDIDFQEFPSLGDEVFGEMADIPSWGENIHAQLEMDEYDCCISNLIGKLEIFGWEIDAVDCGAIEMTNSLEEVEELLGFLTPGIKETLLELIGTEYYGGDTIIFVFLKNHDLGKYHQYLEKKSNKSRIDRMIELRVYHLINRLSELSDHYESNFCSSSYEEGVFCAVCAYGSFASMDAYLGLYEFDPINIIRAWYLKQYLEIAQRLYGY